MITTTNNKGSAVLEATLAFPIFIFAVLTMYFIGQCKLAEQNVYEACVETAEYLAEYGYFKKPDTLLAGYKFSSYIDDEELISKYVKDGSKGVKFYSSYFGEDDFKLRAKYKIGFDVPFVGALSYDKTITIKQRYYTGKQFEKEQEKASEDEEYVYVTDNRDVYHSSRKCTHLMLSVSTCNYDYAKKNGYTSCERCKGYPRGTVYITDSGDRFHCNEKCSGLKRTIYRVKKKEVAGLSGCLRCVN